jgi:serine/threonine protein kinase
MAGQDESHTEIADLHGVRKDAAQIARGTVLAGRYQIEKPLGRGGAGVALRAFDRELQEAVAIKVLHPDLAQETRWIERLAREVKLARQLRHPNVCRVFDFEKADGHVFIVMELATGGSLRRELDDPAHATRPLESRLADARAVAEGLAAIHAAGIVHRDVTPQNVLRMADGRLVVSDFGLATEVSHTASFHGGTVAYMAPEVARGQRADFAADVWSLGVVIHEIVFGVRPTWSKPVGGALLTPAKNRTLTAGERLAYDVCRACTADRPEERPRSAAEVAAQLAGKRGALVMRPARWLMAALLVTGTIAVLNRTRRLGGTPELVEYSGTYSDWSQTSKVLATVDDRLDCLIALPDRRTIRYVWGNPKHAEDLDVETGRRSPSPLVTESFKHGCPDVSPDGRHLVYQGYVADGRAFAFVSDQRNGSGAKPVAPIADPSFLSDPKWLADSNSFSVDLDYQHVGIYSLETKRTTVLSAADSQPSVSGFRSTFGSMIYLLASYREPTVTEVHGFEWPLLSERVRFRLPGPVVALASPDGKTLFAPSMAEPTTGLSRIDLARRELQRLGGIPGQMLLFPTFLPDRMVFVSRRDRTDAWRKAADGTFAALTDDGDTIAVAPCGDGYIAVKKWMAVVLLDGSGHTRQVLAEGRRYLSAFCGDHGRDWYFNSWTSPAGVYRCRGRDCVQVSEATPMVSISPDGKRLAIAKTAPAGYLLEWIPAAGGASHEVAVTETACAVSWSSDRTMWVSRVRNGGYVWVEVDVDTRAETGRTVEGSHGCSNGVPDPLAPENRDLRIVNHYTTQIRTISLSALGL